MSRLTKLIASVENYELEIPDVQDVTPEAEEDADIEIKSTADDLSDLQSTVKDDQSAIDEIQTEIVAIEGYIDILKFGIEKKDFSIQYAAAVAQKLNPYQEAKVVEAPALENFNMDTVETYYTTSLEAATDVLQKLKDKITSLRTRLSRRFKAVGTDKGISKTTITKTDALLKRINSAKTDKVKIRTAGLVKYLNMGGKLPSDIPAAVKKDIKNRQYVLNKLTLESDKFASKVMDVLTLRDQPFIPEAEIDKIMALKHPFLSIPKEIQDGSGLFYTRIEIKEHKTDSDNKATQLVDHVNVKLSNTSAKLDNPSEELELSRSDVKAIADSVKTYATFLAGVKSPDFSILDLPAKFDYESGMKPVVVQALVDSLFGADVVTFNTIVDARQIMVSLTQLVERATKELEKEKKED